MNHKNMSIERPYYPSEEEYERALVAMSDEEWKMSEERAQALESEVVEALCAKGKDNPESKGVLINWIKIKEHEARLTGTSEAQIKLAIQAASVYKRSGYFNEALEELRSTEEAAASENDGFELYNRIKALEDEIQSEGGESETS